MTIMNKFKKLSESTINNNQEIFPALKLPNDFNNKQEHINMIKNLFEDFYKESIVNDVSFNIDNMSRAIHTNTVFLLGYLIYKESTSQFFKNDIYDGDEKQFQLTWFLVSIVHDFMFDIENEKSNNKYEKINGDIDSIINHFDIKEKLLEMDFKTTNTKIQEFLEIIPQYFKYRFCHDGKIDHGIIAGIKIFDLLVRYRKQKHNNNDKYWKTVLDKLYAEVGLSIASHNIWAPDTPIKEKTYNDYGLDALCQNGEDNVFPIKFSEMPYLFLLGLVDTIEPTKTYSTDDASYVLENIALQVSKNSITLSNCQNSTLDFSLIKKKIIGLENWLDVKICVEQNKIKIEWK